MVRASISLTVSFIGTVPSVLEENIKHGQVFSSTFSGIPGAVGQYTLAVFSVITGYPRIQAAGRLRAIVAAAAARCPPAENPITAIREVSTSHSSALDFISSTACS